jgi:hypothetical protein
LVFVLSLSLFRQCLSGLQGLDGILNAYNQTVSRVTLYGPTIFSQVLHKAFQMAGPHCTQDVQRYQILMLLTDGVLDDLEASIDQIVKVLCRVIVSLLFSSFFFTRLSVKR